MSWLDVMTQIAKETASSNHAIWQQNDVMVAANTLIDYARHFAVF